MWKIPLFDLAYDERETQAVLEVLASKWLSTGSKTMEFETKFADYLGAPARCCAVANGTAALHMALILAGVKEGDEVIISGLTFVADLNVVVLVGGIPVIADSKSFIDWNTAPDDIARKITSKTKAIIIVHYAGYPADMDEIIALAKKHQIIVIEDAAHAIGAEYKGKKCGVIGDIGCYSFFANKNLATGEGGMVVTTSPEIYQKARLLRSHGMTSMTIDRYYNSNIKSYDVVFPGFNYRFDEIRAALGIVQLEKLEDNNRKRADLVKKYIELLSPIKEIIIPFKDIPTMIKPSYHIFPVLLTENKDRVKVMNAMVEKGIQTSIHYPSFANFSYYQTLIQQDLPIANAISQRVLTLPLYPGMSDADVEFVVDSLGAVIHA